MKIEPLQTAWRPISNMQTFSQKLHLMKEDLIIFWQVASDLEKEGKLELLREFSNRVYFKRTSSLRRYRKHFNENYRNLWLRKCFVCGLKAEHRHHIIQLQNGGLNSKKNRIPICKSCHTSVHPWLKTGEGERTTLLEKSKLTMPHVLKD